MPGRAAPPDVVRRVKFSLRLIRESMKHHGPLTTPEMFKLMTFPGTPINSRRYLKQYLSRSGRHLGHFTKHKLAFPRPVSDADEPELKERVVSIFCFIHHYFILINNILIDKYQGSHFVWELTDLGLEQCDSIPIELEEEDEARVQKYIIDRPKME